MMSIFPPKQIIELNKCITDFNLQLTCSNPCQNTFIFLPIITVSRVQFTKSLGSSPNSFRKYSGLHNSLFKLDWQFEIITGYKIQNIDVQQINNDKRI